MAYSVSSFALPLFCNELDFTAGGSRTGSITWMTAFEHDQKPHDILWSSFTLRKPTATLPDHLKRHFAIIRPEGKNGARYWI